MSKEPAYTVTDVALRLGVTADMVYRKLRDGRLMGAQRVNGQWLIPESAVVAWEQKRNNDRQ